MHAHDLMHVHEHRSKGGLNEHYSVDMEVTQLHKYKNNIGGGIGGSGGKSMGMGRPGVNRSTTRKLTRPNTKTKEEYIGDFLAWGNNNPLTADQQERYLQVHCSTPLSPSKAKGLWDLEHELGSDKWCKLQIWELNGRQPGTSGDDGDGDGIGGSARSPSSRRNSRQNSSRTDEYETSLC